MQTTIVMGYTGTVIAQNPNTTGDAADTALVEGANELADLYAATINAANDLADEYANRLPQTPGMYMNRATGVIYRVKMNQAKTGMYAYTLNGQSWTYAGGLAANGLRETNRMTVGECDLFSVKIGVCCLCGRELTNLTSVERGMGPICREKQAGV